MEFSSSPEPLLMPVPFLYPLRVTTLLTTNTIDNSCLFLTFIQLDHSAYTLLCLASITQHLKNLFIWLCIAVVCWFSLWFSVPLYEHSTLNITDGHSGFSAFACHEQCCYEYSGACLLMHVCMHVYWIFTQEWEKRMPSITTSMQHCS